MQRFEKDLDNHATTNNDTVIPNKAPVFEGNEVKKNMVTVKSDIIKVDGLSEKVTGDHLREIFSVYGTIKRISLPVESHSKSLI